MQGTLETGTQSYPDCHLIFRSEEQTASFYRVLDRGSESVLFLRRAACDIHSDYIEIRGVDFPDDEVLASGRQPRFLTVTFRPR